MQSNPIQSSLTKKQKEQLESLIDEFNCPFQKDDKCVMVGGARKLVERTLEIVMEKGKK